MSTIPHYTLADYHHIGLPSLAAVHHRLAVIREQGVLAGGEGLVECADVHHA